jgi:hypothetical protein
MDLLTTYLLVRKNINTYIFIKEQKNSLYRKIFNLRKIILIKWRGDLMDEKVHLIPAGFEFDRVVWALETFGVTKIYLLRGTGELESKIEEYAERLKERYKDLVENQKFQEVYLNIFDLGEVFNVCKTIIETEAMENQVFINLSTSTKLLAIALTMTAWCCDTSKMRSLPILYYAKPKEYAHSNLIYFAKQVDKLLKNFEVLTKEKPEELRAFLQELSSHLQAVSRRGMSWGRDDIILIPFMPIKLPGDFEMKLLAMIETFGGEVKNIQALVESFEKSEGMRSKSKKGEESRAIRSKVTYHLRNLESRQLISRVPNKRGVRIKITSLGRVFVTPKILKKIEE